MNIPVEERRVTVAEAKDALKNGKISEAFGAGTAAVVAPIKTINISGKDFNLPDWDENCFMLKAKKQLSDIRHGRQPDIHGWNYII
jgi:branched-chain amino acid aminotransferase